MFRCSLVFLFLAAFGFSGCIGASFNNSVSDTAAKVFPNIRVENLEGKTVQFPDFLREKTTVVLFAFQRKQQEELDPWIEKIEQLQKQYPKLDLIEMPVIEESSSLFRLWVNNGMRSGISGEVARRRTMTAWASKDNFRSALGLDSEETIYAVLFDRTGKEIWRTDGPLSEAKFDSLERALRGNAFSR